MKKVFAICAFLILLIVPTLACGTSRYLPQASPTPEKTPQTASVIFQTDLLEEDNALTDIYELANPGVVAIWLFDDQDVQSGLGSGWVYGGEGYIVTNYHVVEGADQYEVRFPSGYRAYGTLVGSDQQSDIAVLQVDVPGEELHPLTLGDSAQLQVGQIVVAIGSPFGLDNTMTTGIVSALGRAIRSGYSSQEGGYFSTADVIQTDAALNIGNSGGPLLNLNGEVVGMNQSISTTTYTGSGDPLNAGIGFAVSANMIHRVLPDLIETGQHEYPFLGISSIDNLSLQEIELLGLERFTGAYVTSVVPGGPADKAGIHPGTQETAVEGLYAGGDLLVAIDGNPVQYFDELLAYLYTNKEPGDEIALTILRGSEQVDVTVTLGLRP